MCYRFVVFASADCKRDEERREHRENVCLDEAHQDVEQEHKEGECHGDDGGCSEHRRAEFGEDENQECKYDDNHVTAHHVSKQTHAECSRLGEDAEELDDRHDGYRELQPEGHVGPENILPVVLVAFDVCDEESADSQRHRHCDVAGKVCTAREYYHEPKQVHEEYQEKDGKEVSGKARRFVFEGVANDAVVDKRDEHFEETHTLTRCFFAVSLIESNEQECHQSDESGGNQERADVFGD